jgi:hypothetical protein
MGEPAKKIRRKLRNGKKEADVYQRLAEYAKAQGLRIVDKDGVGIDEEVRRMQYRARPHQAQVIKSKKKLVFMGGGVGAGKTDVGSIWVWRKAGVTPKGVVGVICANTYSQLLDSTLWNCYRKWNEWGLDVRPRDLPKVHRPFNIHIYNGNHFVEIRCRSLDAYQLLSGQEVGWIWVDEAFLTKKEAIDVLLARLRDKRMPPEDYLQLLMTTTLDEPSGWMYELFVDNFDPRMMEVLYARTYDNLKNLPDDYIPTLQKLYTKRMFERMVDCKWVALDADVIYYNFERNVHISKHAEYDPYLPIIWSHDFNIGSGKPMSSCLGQVKRAYGPDGVMREELHWFDEIVIESADTNEAVEEFKQREWVEPYQYERVIVHGDASGKSRDTRSKTTDYGIIEAAGFDVSAVPRSNPPIRERHNAANALLKNAADDVRMLVHPRCKQLAKGLETCTLKKGAQYLEDDTIFSQHVTAACTYAVNELFPCDAAVARTVRVTGH